MLESRGGRIVVFSAFNFRFWWQRTSSGLVTGTNWAMRPRLVSSQLSVSCAGFQSRSASKSRSLLLSTRRCLGTWLTTAASSLVPAPEVCARQRLEERFSSVWRSPTSATEPAVQLELVSGTICRRTPDLSYSRFTQSPKTFLVE